VTEPTPEPTETPMPVTVPMEATIPTAVPAGGGSSTPEIPLWAWALMIATLTSAAGAGARLVIRRRCD
jgi:hypothetical protein